MEKEKLKEICELYFEKNILREKKDLSMPFDEEEIDEIESKIKENSIEILQMLKNENFLKILKELIDENPEKFQISFAEPYDEDFINIVVFDLYKKKIISKENINELKSFYSDKNISISIES